MNKSKGMTLMPTRARAYGATMLVRVTYRVKEKKDAGGNNAMMVSVLKKNEMSE